MYDWANLAHKDMVTPELFNTGYLEDGYPGLQQGVHDMIGHYDTQRNLLLSGFEVTYNAGTAWSIASGAAIFDGVLTYVNADAAFDAVVSTGYIYVNTGGVYEASASADVAGCLLGEVNGNAFTDYRHGRRLKDTKWTQYNPEHQYFHNDIDVRGAITLASTLDVTGATSLTGAVHTLSTLRVDDDVTLTGTIYMVENGDVQRTANDYLRFTDGTAILNSDGATTLKGDTTVTIDGGAVSLVGDSVAITPNTAIAGTLDVTGLVSIADDIAMDDNSTIDLTIPTVAAEYCGVTIPWDTTGRTVGDCVYLAGSTLTECDSDSSGKFLGIVVSVGSSGKILVNGTYKLNGYTVTAGDIVYVSDTASRVTSSNTGTYLAPVGYALSTTVIYVNGSNVVIE